MQYVWITHLLVQVFWPPVLITDKPIEIAGTVHINGVWRCL